MQIDVRNLYLTFGQTHVIENLSFAIPAGSAVAIVGTSGAGKTSLLRIIAGLLSANKGVALIDGRPPRSFYGTTKLAFLFQEACLCPHLTIWENLELAYWAHRRKPDAVEINHQLEVVGLADASHRYPHEISVGMKARTAIARMLCLPPEVLLMDEPFAALDPVRRYELNKEIGVRCRALRATSVWVSHDVVEALMFANIIIGLNFRGEGQVYDLNGLPPIADAGALSEETRCLRDRIIKQTMREAA